MKITVKRMEQIIEEEVDKFLLEHGQDALDEGVLDRLFGLSGQSKRAGKKAGKESQREKMKDAKFRIQKKIQSLEKEAAVESDDDARNELAREIDQLKASLKGTAGKLRKSFAKGAGQIKAKEVEKEKFQQKFKSKWKGLRDKIISDVAE